MLCAVCLSVFLWRYVLTVVITSHILIINETDESCIHVGHLIRMGPWLIMNICPIFHDPVF